MRFEQGGGVLSVAAGGLAGAIRESYTDPVSRVNRILRDERRARVAAMTPAERLALAEKLGEEGLAEFMSAHGVDRETARKAIRKSRRVGRKRSASAAGND